MRLALRDRSLLDHNKHPLWRFINQAVFAFRRYEDASLSYTGIESYEGLTHYGPYDTVVAAD